MPLICIGPVCIPVSCLPAIIFFVWKFAKPLLPDAWATAIERQAKIVADFCDPYIQKIPGCKRKQKKSAANGQAVTAASFQPGLVGHIASEEHLDQLLTSSKQGGFAVVLDFTAPWCRPCQALKPHFHAMCAEYPAHHFLEVDGDEHDGVLSRCEVKGLPTFQVFVKGERVGSVTGPKDEAAVRAFLTQHLGSPESKKQS